MDFITQFENTLEQTLTQSRIAEARQLVDAFPGTNQPYTLKLYSLINRLRRAELPTGTQTFFSGCRIVLFQTGNFILDYILQQFADFLRKNDCCLLTFDPADYTKSSQSLFSFATGGIDAAFFFNNVGLSQTLQDGRNLWETLEIPCYDFLVDHPMYYSDSLNEVPRHTTLLCADRTHTDYVRRFYPNVMRAIFFPTGGCHPTTSPVLWQHRSMEVLFIGSFKYHSDYVPDVLGESIIAYMQSHTDESFEHAVELCANAQTPDCPISNEQLKMLIEKHRFIETNVTALYRKSIITSLLEADITVHVYGQGWEHTGLEGHPCFILHPPVSFEEGLALMSDTKILLNHMAWFKSGSSERIFNAMAQGAVCFTDSSIYLSDILKDDANCCLYSLNDISIADRIKALLANPEKASAIAKEGLRTAAAHTWQQHLQNYLFFSEA